MKKILILIIIFFMVALVFIIRLLTPEDTWIRDQLGNWVKHGNPGSPRPTEIMPTKKPNVRREE